VHVPVDESGEQDEPGGIDCSVALVPSHTGNVLPGHRDIGVEELAREHRQDAPSRQDGVGGLVASSDGQAVGQIAGRAAHPGKGTVLPARAGIPGTLGPTDGHRRPVRFRFLVLLVAVSGVANLPGPNRDLESRHKEWNMTTAPTFIDLGASPAVVRALADLGITAPFPIQSLVLPDALAGCDVLAKSQTGSGKTLSFAIPLVERVDPAGPTPSALVLTPTRELAAQVADDFAGIAKAKRLRVAVAYGGISIREQGKGVGRAWR